MLLCFSVVSFEFLLTRFVSFRPSCSDSLLSSPHLVASCFFRRLRISRPSPIVFSTLSFYSLNLNYVLSSFDLFSFSGFSFPRFVPKNPIKPSIHTRTS